MFSSRYALLVPLFVAAAVALHAQPFRTVYVGTEPSALIYDRSNGQLHVLGVGLDRNFNGIYEPDSGDVSASWYVVDPNSGAKLDSSLLNGFFSNFPLRVGVDLKGRRLYACVNNGVNEYDLDTRNLVRQLWTGSFAGVSYDTTRGLVLMQERAGSGPGQVVAYNPTEGNQRVEFVLPTAIGPLMTLDHVGGTSNRVENYTLCEGLFGQPNSAVSYTMYSGDDFATVNSDTLGSNATVMVRGVFDIYMALGSQVRVIDAASGVESAISPIDLPGATALKVLGNSSDGSDSLLIVGTSNGHVYWYNLLDGSAIDSAEFGGDEVQTVDVLDSTLLVGIGTNNGRTVAVGMESHLPYDTLPTTVQPLKLFVDRRGDIQIVGLRDATGSTVVRQVFNGGTFALQNEDTLRQSALFSHSVAYDPTVDSIFIAYPDSLLIYGGVGGSSAYTAIDTFNQSFATPRALSLAGDLMLVGDGPRVTVFDLLAWRAIGMFNTNGTPVAMAMATSDQGSGDAHAVVALSNNASGAHLSRVEYNQSVFADTLGSGANSMIANEQTFAIVMNGSHQITLTDPWAGQILTRLTTLTSGFDGPRELVVGEDARYVLTTTYKGDVRSFDEDGKIKDSLDIGGKGEAILAINDTLVAITRPFDTFYGPDSALILLDPRNVTTSDVRRDDAVAGSSVGLEEMAPNPASASTSLRISVPRAGRVQLRVLDMRGRLVATPMDETMESGTWSAQLDVSALPAGSYIVVVNQAAGQAQRVLHVVR